MLVAVTACWLFFVGSVGLFVLGYDPTQSFLVAGTVIGLFGFTVLCFEFVRTLFNGR